MWFNQRLQPLACRSVFPILVSRVIDGEAKPCNLNFQPQDRDPIKFNNMSSSIKCKV